MPLPPDVEPFELGTYDEWDRTYWSALSITIGELMDAGIVTHDWFVTFDAFDDAQNDDFENIKHG